MYLEKQTIIYMIIAMLFGALLTAIALLPDEGIEFEGQLFGETVHIKIGVPEIDPGEVIFDEKNNQVIVDRIKNLSFDHTISRQLRAMYVRMASAFVSEPITVNVVFSEEVGADTAVVCHGSELYDNRVVIVYHDDLNDVSNQIVIPAAKNVDMQTCSTTTAITINDQRGRQLLMLDDDETLPKNVNTIVKVMPIEHRFL